MSNTQRVTIPVLPESDAIKPGKVYTPSPAYLITTGLNLNQPEKKLLVLDLNGTLISRCGQKGVSSFVARPFLHRFFNYIFKYFQVAVWSSAQERTVDNICNIFEDRSLLLKWHRGHFNFKHSEFNSKVEGIKNLERIWKELPQYNITNTIAIDDTPIKLSLQPYNLVKISTFNPLDTTKDNDNTLLQLMDYLELVKDEPNAAFYIKSNPFIEDMTSFEGPIEFSSTGQRMARFERSVESSSTGQRMAPVEDSIGSSSASRRRRSQTPLPLSESSGTTSTGVQTKKKKSNKKAAKRMSEQAGAPLPLQAAPQVSKRQSTQGEYEEIRELKAYIESQNQPRKSPTPRERLKVPDVPQIPSSLRELFEDVNAVIQGDDDEQSISLQDSISYSRRINEKLKALISHEFFQT
jgi:hypothetical protein